MSGSGPLLAAWLLSLAAPPAPEAIARRQTGEERRRTIADTLEALRATEEQERIDTYNYIYAVERNQCQAPLRSLKVGCLLEAARRSCRQKQGTERRRCRLITDTIVANRFSESMFLSRPVRYRIMKEHRDYRERLQAALQQRYARLVTGLYLEAPLPDGAPPAVLAGAIDRYCLAVAGRRQRLSWSHCVAAIVWFIGTSPTEEARSP